LRGAAREGKAVGESYDWRRRRKPWWLATRVVG